MARYFGEFHIVKNFPSEYVWPKKVMANIMYFFAAIHPQPRDNWLDRSDQEEVESLLELGDVLLLGNLRTVFSKFCEGPFTHSGVYCDNARIVNCVADGVGFKDLNQVYREYDTLAVLRLPQDLPDRQCVIQNCLSVAQDRIGMPYDFFFGNQDNAYFCTRFVNSLFLGAGYQTGLESMRSQNFKERSWIPLLYRVRKSLQPHEFVHAFDLVYHSRNMILRDGHWEILSSKK